MAIVNTRLVLRNDELSNWNVSNRELLRGEAALAWLSDDLYEIRIGTGGKTWNQLGESNVKVLAKNVLKDLIAAKPELKHDSSTNALIAHYRRVLGRS